MQGGKIRILFLIDELSIGGTERQLIWLAESLPGDRFEPIIGILRETAFSRGLHLRTPIINFNWTGLPLVKNLSLINKIRIFLVEHKVNILQTQFTESEIYGSLATKTIRSPPIVIATRRNLYHWITDEPFHFRIAQLLLKGARMIVANSHNAKEQCIRLEGTPIDKISVIPNAVAAEKFTSITKAEARTHCGLDPDALLIGVVGNLRTVKGADVFLRAASKVLPAIPAASFILVGEGPQMAQLKMLAGTLGLEDKVNFFGSTHEVHALISALDIAVQPSHSESFSNVLIEYMAAAKPIVATRVGDAEIILDRGRCGVLVDPNSPETMAQSIIALFQAQEKAAAMGQRAREKVLENWTPDKILTKYVDFYETLVR